jgi:hypothetical protein
VSHAQTERGGGPEGSHTGHSQRHAAASNLQAAALDGTGGGTVLGSHAHFGASHATPAGTHLAMHFPTVSSTTQMCSLDAHRGGGVVEGGLGAGVGGVVDGSGAVLGVPLESSSDVLPLPELSPELQAASASTNAREQASTFFMGSS